MIISFYSYKGGVGRTQLAANLAAYLCYYKQRKVLIIDWDMEAPGVDFFFNFDRTIVKHGLLDLFNEFVKTVRNKEKVEETDLPKIFQENGKSDYILNLVKNSNGEGKIDLIPAGNYNDNFVKKVTAFDWFEFYDTLNGKYFIEYLKEELNNSEYDYIFIDSRTGTSDYAGICNIQFPELNVFVIAPTNQNFKGCQEIANSITNSPYVKNGLRKPIIMPILSRLDRTDKISGVWFGKFRETFREEIKDFLLSLFKADIKKTDISDKYLNTYIESTLLEYKTEISYGETLIFSQKLSKIEYITLEKQFALIAEYLEKLCNKTETNSYSSEIINIIGQFEIDFNITTIETDLAVIKTDLAAFETNLAAFETALETADYPTLLELLDNHYGDLTTQYSTLRSTIESHLLQGLMPPSVVLSKLYTLIHEQKLRLLANQIDKMTYRVNQLK